MGELLSLKCAHLVSRRCNIQTRDCDSLKRDRRFQNRDRAGAATTTRWFGRVIALLFLTVGTVRAQSVRFVDDSAPPGGNGLAWSTSYNDLQAAITAAANSAGAITELRVAQGTYRPAAPGGSRVALFILRENLAIVGGFAGIGAIDPDARDVEQYVSILTGDLNSNDGPNFTNVNDNSYHVVGASGVGPSAVLDGFTVTGGYANGGNPNDRGAAVFLFPFENGPTFRRCRFVHNWVLGKGGAMYTYRSTATFTDCTFDDNRGDSGGAIYHLQSSPTYLRCTFQNNICTGLAGAMYNYLSDVQLNQCVFRDNTALAGGAMHNFQSGPTLRNCVLQGNLAAGGLAPSGGAIHNEPGSPTLINCLLSGNSAYLYGGAIFSNDDESNVTVRNCTIFGNLALGGGGIANQVGSISVNSSILWGNIDEAGTPSESAQMRIYSGTGTLNFSSVQGWSGSLGGVGNAEREPDFVDANGIDGKLGTADDDARLGPATNCADLGDPAIVLAPGEVDLDGHARVICGQVDIGAYESGLGDIDCDADIDLDDVSELPRCLNGPGAGANDTGCESFDRLFDQDVDLRDVAGLWNDF